MLIVNLFDLKTSKYLQIKFLIHCIFTLCHFFEKAILPSLRECITRQAQVKVVRNLHLDKQSRVCLVFNE